uniref:DUF2637 domain-containing protein n=1 Tax=Mycobacterium riyadhense TaxID=486698 RepID=A0A653EY06_9MYCO|nr:hypothetical protein BIN_B_04444 [Mycobacterium riyadhense]
MDLQSSFSVEESAAAEAPTRRRAVRFFWVVLIAASGASIAGNAVHAAVNATEVPAWLAAAVATAPPLVLLASTEGLSLLIKVRRRPSIAYWAALIMTIVLAAAAFRLSFDALCDLATRCGIRQSLAWLWPVAVDVTMTQATVSLLALTRIPATPRPAPRQEHVHDTALAGDHVSRRENNRAAQHIPMPALSSTSTDVVADSSKSVGRDDRQRSHDARTARVVASKRTRQSPETVAAVLARHAAGKKISEIGDEIGLHHTTVSRIVATATYAPINV